jgi:hypothetical protein
MGNVTETATQRDLESDQVRVRPGLGRVGFVAVRRKRLDRGRMVPGGRVRGGSKSNGYSRGGVLAPSLVIEQTADDSAFCKSYHWT